MTIRWGGQRQAPDAAGEHKYMGELEGAIMEIAWARERVSVREVVAALRPHRDLAYTTAMTVMGRLAEKGVFARERVGRTDFYRPVYTREQFRATISAAIVDDLVTDFGDVALAQFVDALERSDPARRARLRRALGDGGRVDDGA